MHHSNLLSVAVYFRLQEGTDYLFRVFSMNGAEKSEMLESVLITTKKRRGLMALSWF